MKASRFSILFYLFILVFSVYLFACASLDGLIKQGRLQEAEEYCKKQSGQNRQKCYNKLADAYLQNNNYDKAVNYYTQTNNSKAIQDGYIKVASAYMDGELADSTLKIDVSKAQYYLRKVYNDEKEIFTEMAEYFEKRAYESKESAKKSKKLVDMGIISVGKRGKNINIEKLQEFSNIQTERYFTEAIVYFDKLNNKAKAEKLRES